MKSLYLFLRGAVVFFWLVACLLAVGLYNQFGANMASAQSAPQQCAAVGIALVKLMMLYVFARAIDRVLSVLGGHASPSAVR